MYNYREEMTEVIVNRLLTDGDQYDWEDSYFEDKLNDDFWTDDEITGNGEGGSVLDDEQAVQAIFTSPENRELLKEALYEFGNAPADYKRAICEPGFADLTIRCYLLGECIHKAIERIKEAEGN